MCARSSLTPLFLFAILCSSASIGCTPDEEKITRMIQEHLDRCKKEQEETFAKIRIMGETEPMLVEACSEPVTEIVVDSGIAATAKTGPYTWTISMKEDSGVWSATEVAWNDLHNALTILEDGESDEAVLADGAKKLAAAQEAYPSSAYVRLKRMEMLLKLRKVLRSKAGQDDPNGIGKQAQDYYQELLTWSETAKKPEVGAQARTQVITYLRGLDGFLDMSIDTLGSRDDVLETSIKEALKEKDEKSAEAYRKELEDSQAKRPEQLAALEARKAEVKGRLCKEVAALDPQLIKDAKLKESAVSLKGSVNCAGAPPAANP